LTLAGVKARDRLPADPHDERTEEPRIQRWRGWRQGGTEGFVLGKRRHISHFTLFTEIFIRSGCGAPAILKEAMKFGATF
jgi:hypothetical protein